MSRGLLKSAGKAAAWSAMGNWAGLIGGMVSLVILARLLDPTDFGIYGFVLVALAVPEAIACNSLNESLIQAPELREGHSNSIFGLSLFFATLFYAILFVSTPLIESAFNQPDLGPFLWVMSLVLFIGALIAVPAALLQRRLQFKEIALIDLIGVITGAVVGVIFAFILQNAWALIVMEMSRRTVRLIAFCWFARWIPSLKFSKQDVLDLSRFNLSAVGIRLTTVLELNIPRALVGVFLGPAALGMFNLAFRVQDQAGAALINPFGAIALPFAAMSQNNRETLHKMLRGAIMVATFIAYPAFLGAVAIAPVAVPFVFGEKWIGAVAAIQISLLIGIRRPTATFDAGVLKGVGRPDIVLKISLLCLAFVALIPFAAHHSLEAVMWVLWAQKMFGWVLGALAVQRIVGFSIRQQLIAGSSALFASIVMAAGVYLTYLSLPRALPDVVELIILIAVGGLVYPLFLFAVSPRTTSQRIQTVYMMLRGRKDRAVRDAIPDPETASDPAPGAAPASAAPVRLDPKKVAVVIPLYNDASRIERAAESALAQTLPDGFSLEVIVVDDCSTDDGFERVKALTGKHPNLTVVRQEVNRGPSAARNAALAITDAGWFTPQDSDDLVDPGRIGKLLQVALENDLDWVADNLFMPMEDAPLEPRRTLWPDKPEGPVELTAPLFVTRSFDVETPRSELGFLKPLFNRQCLSQPQHPYRDELRFGEDFELYTRLLLEGTKAWLIDPCGYYLVQRTGSASHSQSGRDHQRMAQISWSLARYPQATDEVKSALLQHKVYSEKEAAIWYLMEGVRSRDVMKIASAFLLSPQATIHVLRQIGGRFLRPSH